MKIIQKNENPLIFDNFDFFLKIFKNHVLASRVCLFSVSRYGGDFWKILSFDFSKISFETIFHQNSSKNHEQLIKMAFLAL